MCVDIECTSIDWYTTKLHGIGVGYSEDDIEYYPSWNVPDKIRRDLADPSIAKLGHNFHGYDGKVLRKAGFEINGNIDDTMITENLVDSDQPLGLKYLAEKYFGSESIEKKQRLDRYISQVKAGNIGGLCALDLLDEQHPHTEIIAEYCKEDVLNTIRIFFKGIERLKKLDEFLKKRLGFSKSPLNYYIEEARPLERVLFDMEYRGIRVNIAEIDRIKTVATKKLEGLEKRMRGILINKIHSAELEIYDEKCEKATEKARAKLGLGVGPCRFSFTNNNHIGLLLYKHCELPETLIFKTEKGKYQTDKTAIGKLQQGLPGEHRLQKVLTYFLEYKRHLKIISTYTGTNKKGIMSKVREVSPGHYRIFPSYRQTTGTGRLSCIAEGQKVQVPSGEVPIEDIKVGDLVYCYDKDKQLTLRPVTSVADNGFQECVRVKWQSSGDGRVGELICTPDHRILHKYKNWIRADKLKRYDKVQHMRREVLSSGRQRIYSTNRGMELEESILKREYFKAPSNLHIHHIDENKSNNSIDNLALVTNSGHIRIHAVNRNRLLHDKKRKTNNSRFSVLKALAAAGGRPTLVSGDFVSFKRLCVARNISIAAVAQRYSGNKIYLGRGAVFRAAQGRPVHDAARSLGIGIVKYKKLCWKYGITYNHAILSVTSVGVRRVYDLSVEEAENFIASEICVHNCSNPNLQNLKRDSEVKKFFIPDTDGEVFDDADYSQIELRTAAHLSQDPTLCASYRAGDDVHLLTASRLFNREITKADDIERQAGKRTNFLTIFDGKWLRLQSALKTDTGKDFSERECKQFIRVWFELYSGVRDYLNEELEFFKKYEICVAETGRVRRLPDIKYGKWVNWEMTDSGRREPKFTGPQEIRSQLIQDIQKKQPKYRTQPVPEAAIGLAAYRKYSHAVKMGYNMPIQGLAASMTKRAMIQLHKLGRVIANQVHDSLVVARKLRDLASKKQLIDIMEQTYPLSVPVVADTKTISTFHPNDKVKE